MQEGQKNGQKRPGQKMTISVKVLLKGYIPGRQNLGEVLIERCQARNFETNRKAKSYTIFQNISVCSGNRVLSNGFGSTIGEVGRRVFTISGQSDPHIRRNRAAFAVYTATPAFTGDDICKYGYEHRSMLLYGTVAGCTHIFDWGGNSLCGRRRGHLLCPFFPIWGTLGARPDQVTLIFKYTRDIGT